MTIAYWCILIVAILPYVWVGIAKRTRDYDNHSPRDIEAKLTGTRKRAYWAQLNTFEAFAPFAAAVIIAHQLHADQGLVNALAMAFVAIRILYGILYLADRPTLRSVVWTAGFICVIGLFIAAA